MISVTSEQNDLLELLSATKNYSVKSGKVWRAGRRMVVDHKRPFWPFRNGGAVQLTLHVDQFQLPPVHCPGAWENEASIKKSELVLILKACPSRERSFLRDGEDLDRIVTSVFSGTVTCVGNPALRGDSAIEVRVLKGWTEVKVTSSGLPSLPHGGVYSLSGLLHTGTRGESSSGTRSMYSL